MGEKDNNGNDTGTPFVKKFKTRKSDVISGLSVAAALIVYNGVRQLDNDIEDIVRDKNAPLVTELKQVRADMRRLERLVDKERERAREAEVDLKADVRELRTTLARRRGR